MCIFKQIFTRYDMFFYGFYMSVCDFYDIIIFMKTYDQCYFINYDFAFECVIYEVGSHACPPGYSYGPIIRNHYIFHYILSGSGTLTLNGQNIKVKAGQGFLITPGAMAYYVADKDTPWHYMWIHLDGPSAPSFFQMLGLDAQSPIFSPVKDNPDITKVLFEMLEHNTQPYYCVGKVYELFDALHQSIGESDRKAPKSQLQYIKRIIEYIRVKYSDQLTATEIASSIGLERSYMTRMFKAATGQTPMEYLTTYRMKRACELLTEGKLSISTIALSVGYTDSFAFSKAFKRVIGQSPSTYKQ